MSHHPFRAAHTCAAVAALTVFAAQGAAALPPRTVPPHAGVPVKPGPDLGFQSAWAQVVELPGRPAVHTDRIPGGHAFGACFVVSNTGSAPSGPYTVSGSNVGTPTIQSRNEAGLAKSASHQDCLGYIAPSKAGYYNVELTLTAQNKVVAKTTISFSVYRRF